MLEAGDFDTKNPRCQAVDTVIAVSPGNKLLLPNQPFALIQMVALGRRVGCEGYTVWCFLISSVFKGLDQYWWLKQITYAGEFLAWKRFLQRA